MRLPKDCCKPSPCGRRGGSETGPDVSNRFEPPVTGMTPSSTARELHWLGTHRLAGAYAAMLGRRRTPSHGSRPRSAVIVAPASPGSLGDDAMMSALATHLAAHGFERLRVAAWQAEDEWRSQGVRLDRIRLPQGGLGQWIRFAHRIREDAALFVVGADMLDGCYGLRPALRLLGAADLAGRLGLMTVVTGCSYGFAAHPLSVRFLRRLSHRVQVLARDRYSKCRLEEALRRPAVLVADVAFLLSPARSGDSPLASEVCAWIRQQRQTGARLVLACNVNPLPLAQAGHSVGPLIEAYRETLMHLDREAGPVRVVLVPHDHRQPSGDVGSLWALNEALPAGLVRNTVLLERPSSAAEAKAIIGECDLALSGRMHLAIAALGSGVPVVSLGYQGKCEGLFQHFDLEDLVLDWREALKPGRLVSWVTPIVARRKQVTAQIAARLPGVLDLAALNLGSLGLEPKH